MEKQFKDSSIPQSYSTGLYSEKAYDLAAEHAIKVLDVMFTGVSLALNDLKSKEHPVVFKFSEANGEFLAAGIIVHIPGEDGKPGAWNYSWTLNEEDIPEKARICTAYDAELASYFRTCGCNKYGMIFDKIEYMGEMFNYMFNVIRRWLNDNATDTEVVELVAPGLVTFRVGVEDGEKVMSAEIDGEIKQIIKSDVSNEA